MGSIGQNSTFSEHGHVAFQIKENHDCSNTVPYILPADPPNPTLEMGSIGKGHVAYQIKWNHEI